MSITGPPWNDKFKAIAKEMKTMQELTSQAMQRLSAAQPQSEGFEIKLRCTGCGRERESKSRVPRPGLYAYECGDCAFVRRERRFRNLCPLLYQNSDETRLPAAQLKQAMDWSYGHMGILLTGDTGTGKTRVAWLMLRRILVQSARDYTFEWFDAIGFGHEISRHYRDEDAEDWFEKLASSDLVFFDDLGKLKLTERAETELFGLIERRCAARLPIVATTNDTGDTLGSRLTDNRGPALIRRLREFCNVIRF